MNYPIFFVHTGNSLPLLYCLAQTRATNPDARIILLGDESNSRYAELVEHHLISNYSRGADRFTAVYKHLSTHAPATELIWYNRWFMIEQFMREHGLTEAFIADTDVMLYCDIESQKELFSDVDFTLAQYRPGKFSGHYMFLNTVDALTAFCEFAISLYDDPKEFAMMEQLWEEYQREYDEGGIGDMAALGLFKDRGIRTCADTAPVTAGRKFDQNIREDETWFELEPSGDRKKIVWRDNVPHGFLLEDGSEIPFMLLHFNGRAKAWMEECYRGEPIPKHLLSYADKTAKKLARKKKLSMTIGKMLKAVGVKEVVRKLVKK